MDILKLSTDWAKAEVFSAKIICLASILFFLVATCFWILGKTPMARAFILPMVVAGILLIVASAGLYFTNKPRIAQFETTSKNNTATFVQTEIERTSKSQKDFVLIFKIFPLIIIASALLIMLVPTTFWRTIGITIIVLIASLMLIDSNTDARNTKYLQQLKWAGRASSSGIR